MLIFAQNYLTCSYQWTGLYISSTVQCTGDVWTTKLQPATSVL